MTIERIDAWTATGGTDALTAITDALTEAQRLDAGRSGERGELRRYVLLFNQIALAIDAERTANEVFAEFERRATNGEGYYGSGT